MSKSTLRTGDQVLVLSGANRGKQARVIRVQRNRQTALIDGVNLVTRHTKPTTKTPQGGRIQQPAPITWSNLQLVCPSCSKPTKTTVRTNKNGERERICRLCSAVIPRKERA